jgi:hypothetical protein
MEWKAVAEAEQDIFTEPDDVDIDTLNNLGPLSGMAGIWVGEHGVDVAPKADGPDTSPYSDRIDLQPIDPQANGPQLFYGLRYHQRVQTPGETGAFHDQVGYWLWEPATGMVLLTLSIPRGQTAMAMGYAAPDARSFELVAKRGSTVNGICSNPFLEEAFRTEEFRIKVTKHDDGSWSYDQTTVLMVKGRSEPFLHTDRSHLRKIAAPEPNLKLVEESEESADA